ncbi:MAG TPA: hypothetical protein DEB31_03725 [Clostridiales bacterium]|nr:hypothetical protein [Clostridiales bacterium]
MDIRTSKTKLFLMELIIIILVFSIAGAVCIDLFAQARLLSVNSTDTTNAMIEAQSAAEMVRNTNGDPRSVAGFPQAAVSEDGYTVYYDANWGALPGSEGAVYQMRVAFSQEGNLFAADITVEKAGAALYQINTVRYMNE